MNLDLSTHPWRVLDSQGQHVAAFSNLVCACHTVATSSVYLQVHGGEHVLSYRDAYNLYRDWIHDRSKVHAELVVQTLLGSSV